MRISWRIGWSMVLVAALLVTACGSGDDDDADTEMPNPASEFCEEQGGTVQVVTEDDGSQKGICRLPDGTEIDEWEYYRSSHDDSTGLANPAAVFCEEQGGIVSGEEPMCELPDGSVVDAWEYFRENGESSEGD